MHITETEGLQVHSVEIKKGALVLRAINHKLRQEMLSIIHTRGRINVTDLYIKMRLEQSVASQHLSILRRAGFVLTEREGKTISYRVNYGKLDEVHETVNVLVS